VDALSRAAPTAMRCYTNCTAGDRPPATGKIVWYYQHIPGETHDLDEAFERILIDVGGRQSVFSMASSPSSGSWIAKPARS
jgi:alcohol dehydrogenase (cytochrome c)